MEQAGLRPRDLIPYIGSKSKVSEVLGGRRRLSLTMIRKLVSELKLPPEALLTEPKVMRPSAMKPQKRRRRLQGAGVR
jgi:HTH-type transcriptional regulator/antitoxin HigA